MATGNRCQSWRISRRRARRLDTLNVPTVPTYRHEKFTVYQGGREFDDALLEQLEVLPEFVAATAFRMGSARFEAAEKEEDSDSLMRRVKLLEARHGQSSAGGAT